MNKISEEYTYILHSIVFHVHVLDFHVINRIYINIRSLYLLLALAPKILSY